ncbi:MAG: ribonuclease HI family protein [Candidatus Odinarchaeia archaeon]
MLGFAVTGGASIGKCAIGVIICDQENKEVRRHCEFIGQGTNNEAEYKALIKGLKIAAGITRGKVFCFSDSQLMINHLNKVYRLKADNLRTLFIEITNLEKQFEEVRYTHVGRDHPMIREVDKLVNQKLNEVNGAI